MTEVRKVGVVGLGAMGAGIAQLCIEAGLDTVGREVSAELGEQARDRIGHFLTRKVDKGQLEQAARDDAMSRLSLTTELDAFADCDVVIEAIVEELEPKRELFAELERICRPDSRSGDEHLRALGHRDRCCDRRRPAASSACTSSTRRR